MSRNQKLGLKEKMTDNELDISLMGLVEVPLLEMKAFSHRLNTLDLSNNRIRDLPLDFAPSLRQLVFLDLSKNLIGSLPENMGFLSNLQHLDLYKNDIQRLPLSMGRMTKLRWLDIKDNPLVSTLVNVCGSCSNQAECRTCARNVVGFMQQLEQKLLEEEMDDKPDNVSPEMTTSRSTSKPKKAGGKKGKGTKKMASGDNTDEGLADDWQPSMIPVDERTSLLEDESDSLLLLSVNEKDERYAKSRRHVPTQFRQPTQETTNSGLQVCKEIIVWFFRWLVFIAFLFVSGFLLGLAFDEKSVEHFLVKTVELPELAKIVMTFQGMVQRGMMLLSGYIPPSWFDKDSSDAQL